MTNSSLQNETPETQATTVVEIRKALRDAANGIKPGPVGESPELVAVNFLLWVLDEDQLNPTEAAIWNRIKGALSAETGGQL